MVRTHQHTAAVSLALLALSTPAYAQHRPRPQPAAQPAPAPLPPPPPAEPTAVEIETARNLFREGVECFQREQWGCARDRFLRTYRMRPSPLVRFNLALASHNDGQYIESIAAYRAFLREAPDTPEWSARREAATREIAELERRRAWLRVVVTGDAVRSFRLDSIPMSPESLGAEMPVDPGSHHIVVEGVGGNEQSDSGSLVEGEHFRVELNLPPAAAVQRSGAEAGWRAHTHSFGRQGVTRAGPGGRFIDWSQQEPPTVSAVWERFPVTFAAQLTGGSMTGVVGLSARYFPQPWFGVELAGGVFSPHSTSGATLLAHLRIPLPTPSRWAFGLFAGPLVSNVPLHLQCSVMDNCADQPPARTAHALGAWVNVGASVEWRFTTHLSLRGLVGIQRLLNPATIRGLADHASYTCAESSHATVSACEIYAGQDEAPSTQPFVAIDFGYSI